MARSFLKFALLGAAASFVPAIAQAADLPAEIAAPILAPEPVAGWAGFYAGSLVGYGWSNFETSQGGGSTDGDVDGSTGGGLIGYNGQSGAFVYGIEGDITLHVLRGDIDGGAGVAAVEADSMYSARVRARLGYDMGWAMPFIAAGGVMNESYIHASADRFDGDVQRLYGWTAGAGIARGALEQDRGGAVRPGTVHGFVLRRNRTGISPADARSGAPWWRGRRR